MRQLARDPFARTTLVRATMQQLVGGQTCSWCGGLRHTRAGRAYLYRYGTEPDAIHRRIAWHDGAFCSKSCHDSYHF